MNNKGLEIYKFAEHIFPYCRSITGAGVRKTLADIKKYIEMDDGPCLDIKAIRSGTKVFDWTVPKEWVIRAAYIEDKTGNKIINMDDNNLHVMGYSTPIDEWVDLEELKKHIYVQEDQPDVIPYVTSYYKERYGFCMSLKQLNSLPNGQYHMFIDSELIDGNLNYAEVVIKGQTDQEIFFSTYFCHPSMANNECSGPALAAELIKYISHLENRRYTYHFLFIPETIGSITYLSLPGNLAHLQKKVIAGFNLSCVGDNNDYSIVESRYANTLADKALKNILSQFTNDSYSVYSFLQRGSDERQYNAPGVELPVVCFCRSKFGEFPEYHTSADNMDYVSPEGFQGSYDVMTRMIRGLEYNNYYKMKVLCEPQLGKRGLYPTISKKGSYASIMDMTNFMTYADGGNDLFDISNIINTPVEKLIPIVNKLLENDLLEVLR